MLNQVERKPCDLQQEHGGDEGMTPEEMEKEARELMLKGYY